VREDLKHVKKQLFTEPGASVGVETKGVEAKACPSPPEEDVEEAASIMPAAAASIMPAAAATAEGGESLLMSKFRKLSLGEGGGQADGGGESGRPCRVEVWSPKEVAEYVSGLTEDFGERAAVYAESMTREDINGKAFVVLTGDDLKVSLRLLLSLRVCVCVCVCVCLSPSLSLSLSYSLTLFLSLSLLLCVSLSMRACMRMCA
jgi:hypothetical protein